MAAPAAQARQLFETGLTRVTFRPIREFVLEHLPIIIMFGMLGVLAFVILYALILSRINFGGDGECSLDSRPAAPALLTVVQDPDSLLVTATVRDESDNEQWFALERTIITRINQRVVVGTDIPVPDSTKMRVSRETDRTVTIDDRGIVEDKRPIPGQEYVYQVRAWNCFGPSEPSNAIKILSLFPS